MSKSKSRSPQSIDHPKLGRVCRLGLASRGGSGVDARMVLEAIDRGIDYLNWCGESDGMSKAIRDLGSRREQVKVAVQLSARTSAGVQRELAELLAALGTDYLDVVTYYYVERPDEWARIRAPGGAAETLEAAREAGKVRLIGLTSHQRTLAADIAGSGSLDLLMIRYNAAHRGAERQIFPTTDGLGMPVVAYTSLRWGALLRSTPDDPPGFELPRASDWYRWVLANPSVTVCLAAPENREELEEDLTVLEHPDSLADERYAALRDHGDRVRRHAGSFL